MVQLIKFGFDWVIEIWPGDLSTL